MLPVNPVLPVARKVEMEPSVLSSKDLGEPCTLSTLPSTVADMLQGWFLLGGLNSI